MVNARRGAWGGSSKIASKARRRGSWDTRCILCQRRAVWVHFPIVVRLVENRLHMLVEQFIEKIATEVAAGPEQVEAAIKLFDGGATLPFVARYRKDVTGNLDEVKLESIEQRNLYFTALAQRRNAILQAIEKQGKLTGELRTAIEACDDNNRLEDLYLPYKKKRRTKATVAREQGLQPLADFLWEQAPGEQTLEEFAQTFVRPEKAVPSLEEALAGARHILAEGIANDAEARTFVRQRMAAQGKITSCTTKNSEGKKTKFEPYYEFSEAIGKIPSHRLLAILRGVKVGLLRMELVVDDRALIDSLVKRYLKEPGSPFETGITAVVEDAYKRLIQPSIENEVVAIARRRADEEAIHVFRENAQSLLLASPAGPLAIIGIDPGLRSGCKIAVVDQRGAFLENATLFPHPPESKVEEAETQLLALMDKYQAFAVAIGNGTGSRETLRFVNAAIAKLDGKKAFSIIVNEAGASVYSVSKVAREEFPGLDVTVRGAISIARRLQDPLAELVKIEPRSIGVGQYQHDVNQKLLKEGLHRSVVWCVNKVGVDLNTASVPLLRYVSGIQYGTAQNIVSRRSENGGYKNRNQLLDVDGIGPKVFEQCAGFLRIPGGDNALDATAIHPEAYPVVEKIAESLGLSAKDLIGNREELDKIDLAAFESETAKTLTLADLRNELLRPGRDPRSRFKVPQYLEGVSDVNDLEIGMEIEGLVTNVTNFGAFVDIGIHQDGLVHLSELANRYVQDPLEVVHVGEIIRVKVIALDKELPRISLSRKALQPTRKKKTRKNEPRSPAPSETAEGTERQAGTAERKERQSDAGGPQAPERPRPTPRPRRERQDRKERTRKPDGKPPKKQAPRPKTRTTSGDTAAPLNTQLADQLAALRDKLDG